MARAYFVLQYSSTGIALCRERERTSSLGRDLGACDADFEYWCAFFFTPTNNPHHNSRETHNNMRTNEASTNMDLQHSAIRQQQRRAGSNIGTFYDTRCPLNFL